MSWERPGAEFVFIVSAGFNIAIIHRDLMLEHLMPEHQVLFRFDDTF
ncbi:MAG TPA: hypothetical protein PKV41_00700 [Candidatus Omnitrophota bacterium]|nr:hypothetical protein [Candidatus Omnitrophota bacterium]